MAPTRAGGHIGGDVVRGLAYAGGAFAGAPRLAEGAGAALDQMVWWAEAPRTGRASEVADQRWPVSCLHQSHASRPPGGSRSTQNP